MSKIKAEIVSSDDEVISGQAFVIFYVVYTYNDRFMTYAHHRVNLVNLNEYETLTDRIEKTIINHKKVVEPLLTRGEEINGLMGKVV